GFVVGGVSGSGVALAAGGNSVAAHLCQHGGYLVLQDGNGQPFSSQTQCVSYGAQGGTVYQPVLTLDAKTVGQPGACGPVPNVFAPTIWCISVTGSGFHSNSAVTVTVADSPGTTSTFPAASTDATGGYVFEH